MSRAEPRVRAAPQAEPEWGHIFELRLGERIVEAGGA